MSSKRSLERRLSKVVGFGHPRIDLEQYATPADVAAHLVHLADLEGDLEGRTIVDLGAGTGILAIAAAFRSPDRVLGVELDPEALCAARGNERRVDPPTSVDWLLGDASCIPLCPAEPVTVLMNPPFGAQRGNVHADRDFLSTTSGIASVSYSFHNDGSRDFVEAFTRDRGGVVTHAYRVSFDLGKQFEFHERERATVPVELYRVDWT